VSKAIDIIQKFEEDEDLDPVEPAENSAKTEGMSFDEMHLSSEKKEDEQFKLNFS